ncbi:MAG: GntR family transcriptional regulator [Desulfobacterium sp.]
MSPKKIKKRKEDFTQEAYMGIRRMFFNNEIIPGQKISYRDLAERLEMSATPIIQALKRLEFQGLVRHEPNCGYYTEKTSIEEITEIYDFRKIIEVALVAKTIQGITAGKLAKLKKALESHLSAVRDVYLKDRLLRDREFHMALAELSGCTLQINTLRHLFDLLYLKYRGNILFVTPMDTVDDQHSKIYEHIAAKDIEGAQNILGQHILNVKKHALISVNRVINEKSAPMI